MPIVEKLSIASLIRIKVNFYPRTEEMKIHAAHKDYPFDHNGALFYVNSCDGYTVLEDGTKIESIANRVLVFNGVLYIRQLLVQIHKVDLILILIISKLVLKTQR